VLRTTAAGLRAANVAPEVIVRFMGTKAAVGFGVR
jgi:hypothetical protein